MKITHPETDPANIISGDIRDLYTYLDIPGPESYQLNLLSVQTKNEISKKNKSSDLKNDKFVSNLNDSIKESALEIFSSSSKAGIVRGRSSEKVAAAAIYTA